MPLEFVGCIGGCDETLREILDLRFSRGPPRAPQPASQPSNYLQASQSLNRMASAPRMLPPPAAAATEGSNSVTCNCGQEAVLLTVRKEGPNQGRQFYKCHSGGCSFFLWADSSPSEAGGPPSSTSRPTGGLLGRPPATGDRRGGSGQPGDEDGGGGMSCLCSQPAVTRTVQKDGPNKGRQFHTCAKPREQQCGFFQWVDENVAPGEAGRPGPGSGLRGGLHLGDPGRQREGRGQRWGWRFQRKGRCSSRSSPPRARRCAKYSGCLHVCRLGPVRPRRPRINELLLLGVTRPRGPRSA